MTTEIAVVNRLGVALATDSAVTVSDGTRMKVFDTGDKLFELSEVHPVGVMINGNMDFLEIPWEILIKSFRDEHGDEPRASIPDWCKALFEHVAAHPGINELARTKSFRNAVMSEIASIQGAVLERLRPLQQGSPAAGDPRFHELISRLLDEELVAEIDFLGDLEVADSLMGLDEADYLQRHRNEINSISDEQFKPTTLSDQQRDLIAQAVVLSLFRYGSADSGSGLIVAGYGADKFFPALEAFHVDGVVDGRIKHTRTGGSEIDRTSTLGATVSFAQTDVIDRLLAGADPRFISATADFIRRSIAGLGDQFGNGSTGESAEQSALRGIFENAAEQAAEEFETSFAPRVREQFLNEFNSMIAMMPKQELIELAESLVSVTVVERKAQSETATVGGPIDVAMITKNEGFVWIKRKHFFDARLNPRYGWRKFGSGRRNGGGDGNT